MRAKLLVQAIIKFTIGLIMIGALLFLPAGGFDYWNTWLFIGLLFIPMFLFSGITGRRFPAKSNLRLKRKEGDGLLQDDFRHEQCLVVRQDGKHILLSGCAHNGILNILDRYREIYAIRQENWQD